jgi:transcriptional regulator with XRE-family HTH domain
MAGGQSKPLSGVLRELRQRHGWTLQEMSRRSGIPVSTLSKVECGRLNLRYDRLVEVSERLGLTLPQLLGVENPQPDERVTGRRSIGNVERASRVNIRGREIFLLCPELRHKRLTPFITHVLADVDSPVQRVSRHDGEHFAYVLAGQVEVQTEFYEPIILGTGECIYIDANMEHAYGLAPNCAQATILGILLGSFSGEPEWASQAT